MKKKDPSNRLAPYVREGSAAPYQAGKIQTRSNSRKRFYLSDRISVLLHSADVTTEGSLIDLDIKGIGAVFPMQVSNREAIQKGKVQVELRTPLGRSYVLHGEVVSIAVMQLQGQSYLRVGIRLINDLYDDIGISRKIGTLFPILENFQPQAFANDPLILGEPIFFRVSNFSCRGLTLVVSKRNKNLVPGISLQLSILLPNQGQFEVECIPLRIKNRDNQGPFYQVDAEIKGLTPKIMEGISEFVLIGSPGVGVGDLRKCGFFIGGMDHAISISHPQTPEEFRDMLQLRLNAYHQAGKLLDRKSPTDMWDEYDDYSRHIVAKVGGRTVGAMRVVFVGKDLLKSEHSRLGVALPEKAKKHGFVEYSRGCTDPSYRGADVLPALIRHCIRVTAQNGIPFVIANCNPEMWEMYRRMGAKKFGKPFAAFGRQDCQIIIFDSYKVFDAKDGDFLTWNYIVWPLIRFLSGRDPAIKKISRNPRFWIHSWIHKFVRALVRRRAYRKYKKKRPAII